MVWTQWSSIFLKHPFRQVSVLPFILFFKSSWCYINLVRHGINSLVIFENNVGHMACCNTTVLGPQIQNFILICCFFTWRRASEGLRKSLKSLTNTKISPKQFFKTFLKVLPETTCILFFYLTAKNKENFSQKFLFTIF